MTHAPDIYRVPMLLHALQHIQTLASRPYSYNDDEHDALVACADIATAALGHTPGPYDDIYRRSAHARYHDPGSCEVAPDAPVSSSADGAYVAAWVWIDADNLEAEA